jgi:hypothetical protein
LCYKLQISCLSKQGHDGSKTENLNHKKWMKCKEHIKKIKTQV